MQTRKKSPRRPRVAIVGCGHGSFDAIYAELASQCILKGWTISDIDLLIICGDIQAVRNPLDLNCMSIPRKHLQLGDFHEYYSGQSLAPVLTLVIGGNHEASNYFFELYHGGWLAPNIYYLGAAGIVRYGPWRIAGLSGIYSKRDHHTPHHERLPYDRDTIKSIYHVRDLEVRKLLAATEGYVDIMLSHDWPAWVELFGDHEELYASKPTWLASAKGDGLGSKPATQLLNHLRPSYWFSGHMHARFEADVPHSETSSTENSIRTLSVSESLRSTLPIFKNNYTAQVSAPDSSVPVPRKNTKGATTTKFLALGKVGQSISEYLELVELDIPPRPDGEAEQHHTMNPEGKYELHYDEEWIAITRAYNEQVRLTDPATLVVPPDQVRNQRTSESIAQHRVWVRENIASPGLLKIPENFIAHAPVYSLDDEGSRQQPVEYPNRQTAEFAELLEMKNKFAVTEEEDGNGAGSDGIEFGWD